jgi:hypothetical protein
MLNTEGEELFRHGATVLEHNNPEVFKSWFNSRDDGLDDAGL